ncbi:MAG: hypothetical protein KAH68_04275 [Draconibacterium sp.]|nr:hypothetical protein [Draconibacterium sp.]
MKKLLFVTVLLVLSISGFSQLDSKELKYYQSVFGETKKDMISTFIELDEGDEFWILYDEFEKARQEYGEKRYELLLEYAGNYVNYSDDRMDILMKESLANRAAVAKLSKKYYNKIKKASGSKAAAQFLMIESFFEATIRSRILGDLPLMKK